MKKLKKFSYLSQGGSDKNTQYYIMATSQKQVIDLFESIGKTGLTPIHIKNYFYQAWGNDGDELMKDIEITEPCIYSVYRVGPFSEATETPKKLTK